MEDEQDKLLLHERGKYQTQTKELSEERNDLVVQQSLTQQKIDKYKREREDWLAVKDEQERDAQDLRQQESSHELHTRALHFLFSIRSQPTLVSLLPN